MKSKTPLTSLFKKIHAPAKQLKCACGFKTRLPAELEKHQAAHTLADWRICYDTGKPNAALIELR